MAPWASPLNFGNNVHINLHPDTRGEADRLFRGAVRPAARWTCR